MLCFVACAHAQTTDSDVTFFVAGHLRAVDTVRSGGETLNLPSLRGVVGTDPRTRSLLPLAEKKTRDSTVMGLSPKCYSDSPWTVRPWRLDKKISHVEPLPAHTEKVGKDRFLGRRRKSKGKRRGKPEASQKHRDRAQSPGQGNKQANKSFHFPPLVGQFSGRRPFVVKPTKRPCVGTINTTEDLPEIHEESKR